MPAPLALIEDGPVTSGRVVSLHGEIDVGSTPMLREWLARANEGGRRSLVVDLTNVDFLAVSGLYVLCDEQERMAQHNQRLTVICSNKRFLQLFEVCRLGDVLRVVSSRDALSNGVPWSGEDDERAARLGAWLRRYAPDSAGPSEAPEAS